MSVTANTKIQQNLTGDVEYSQIFDNGELLASGAILSVPLIDGNTILAVSAYENVNSVLIQVPLVEDLEVTLMGGEAAAADLRAGSTTLLSVRNNNDLLLHSNQAVVIRVILG